MISHRTTARGALLLTLAAVAAAAASVARPAGAAGDDVAAVPRIVFPLLSDVPVYDNYGDPRVNGSHAGIDIEGAPRRTPVLAAEAGRIQWRTTSPRAGCMLYLYGSSGTTYIYIHLNNDRTMRNDNQGRCADTAYAVADGARVTAGEQIAWNGDSGDADGNPHLHFEVHPKDGPDVNPLPYLKRADRLLFPGRLGTQFSLGLRGTLDDATAGRLSLRVTGVRWWPGGRWTSLARAVTVAVPDDPGVSTAVAFTTRGPGVVTVFTTKSRVTEAALRGDDGALVAARVVGPDGTALRFEPEVAEPEHPGGV